MPIIPLVIWAIIAATAYFTVDTIMSHLSSSVNDKQALMESTAEMAKKLNLTPAQTSDLLQNVSQQTQTSGGISSVTDMFKWGALIYFGMQLFKNK